MPKPLQIAPESPVSAQSQQGNTSPAPQDTQRHQLVIGGIDAEILIKKIADGAYLKDLEAETGLDKRRLSEQLRKHPDYKAAKEASTECQLDAAEEAIKAARDPVDIARARERFRAAAWRAEREMPHRWGQKQEIKHTGQHGPVFVVESVASMPKRGAPSAIIDNESGEVEVSD